jgi:hypothetical protein
VSSFSFHSKWSNFRRKLEWLHGEIFDEAESAADPAEQADALAVIQHLGRTHPVSEELDELERLLRREAPSLLSTQSRGHE